MPSVDDYIAALPSALAQPAAAIRALCDRELGGGSCAVMWGGPTWFVTGDPVCYLRATDAGELLFGFWNGGSLDDPSGRMKAHGSIMGHAVVTGPEDVDADLFAAWLREARTMVRPVAGEA
jgi:hypothetical protein